MRWFFVEQHNRLKFLPSGRYFALRYVAIVVLESCSGFDHRLSLLTAGTTTLLYEQVMHICDVVAGPRESSGSLSTSPPLLV